MSSASIGRGMIVTALVALGAAGAAASPALVSRASEQRPPAGYTGGFGEPTCTACHFDYEVNKGTGSLRIEGIPAHYVAGERYVLTVHLTDPGIRIGGFQLAARFAEGEHMGRQAGSLAPTGPGVDIAGFGNPAVQYARHTDPAIIPADSARRASWKVEWTAPASGGDVVFHVVANAGNDDRSPFGDYIYSAEFRGKVKR